jgi:hypothetical protein
MNKLLTPVVMALCFFGAFTALFMNWVTLYKQDPVEFSWVTTGHSGSSEVVCNAVVLDRPIVSTKAVTDFARDAVLSLNDFTYLSWDVALPEALDRYFTPYAAEIYFKDFSNSKLLAQVQKNYYRSSSISTYPSVLASEVDIAGRREWVVQVPVTINYSTGSVQLFDVSGKRRETAASRTRRSVYQVYTVRLIEQLPTHKNFRGVAVVDMSSVSVRGPKEFSKPKNALNLKGGRL